MSDLIVYTDGGVLNAFNTKGLGAFSFVIPKQGEIHKTYRVHGKFDMPTSSNAMEVYAGIRALEFIIEQKLYTGFDMLIIYTDSTYHRKGATQWLKRWRTNGWVSTTGETVRCWEFWQELDRLMDVLATLGVNVGYRYVKAHSGNEFNEEADALVRMELGLPKIVRKEAKIEQTM